MSDHSVLIVVVLYNKSLFECNTYHTLIKDCGCDVYIHDNSPIPQHHSSDFPKKWHYVPDTSNPGLSVAYNHAAQYAKEKGCAWILLTDQDTLFGHDILKEYLDVMREEQNIKLIVPPMSVRNGVYLSPVKGGPLKAQLRDSVPYGIQSLYNYSPINSGMMVNVAAFFEIGGYNECVKLDFSDFQFVSRLRQKYPDFYVLKTTCVQEFSNCVQNAEQKVKRFVLFCESLREYQGATIWENMEVFLVVLKRCLSLSMSLKSMKPCKIFIKKYCLL